MKNKKPKYLYEITNDIRTLYTNKLEQASEWFKIFREIAKIKTKRDGVSIVVTFIVNYKDEKGVWRKRDCSRVPFGKVEDYKIKEII